MYWFQLLDVSLIDARNPGLKLGIGYDAVER
jgi:hypothetical protein